MAAANRPRLFEDDVPAPALPGPAGRATTSTLYAIGMFTAGLCGFAGVILLMAYIIRSMFTAQTGELWFVLWMGFATVGFVIVAFAMVGALALNWTKHGKD